MSSLPSRPARARLAQTRMERASLPGCRRRRYRPGSLRCCARYPNRIAGHQRFRGTIDNPIGRRQASNDLHAVTEIATQFHALEDDLVIAVEGCDLRTLIAGDERGRRNL